ncbi:MAG: serine hydrolase domain-containing protein [Pseudomonadota bacterium]
MVALLLAKAIQQDQLSAESTLGDVWPEANEALSEIKLIDLASHHSGLPRLPDNLLNQNQTLDNINDPYSSYGLERLQEALKQTTIAPEVTYQYSNFGYGLLAETIAKAQRTTFKDLIHSALFDPMGMTSSGLAIKPGQHSNLIAGHRIDGQAVPHWHFDALAGAGAVISTVDDMVSYIKTLMQPEQNWQPVVNHLLTPQHTLGPDTAQGLAWILEQHDESTLVWHNGQTAGFSSFVGFTADRQRGVVILSNQARTVTNIGKQLLMEGVR